MAARMAARMAQMAVDPIRQNMTDNIAPDIASVQMCSAEPPNTSNTAQEWLAGHRQVVSPLVDLSDEGRLFARI